MSTPDTTSETLKDSAAAAATTAPVEGKAPKDQSSAAQPDTNQDAKPETATPATVEKKEASADKPVPFWKKKAVLAIALDTSLVLLLVAAIGAVGIYLKKAYDIYRVPTPMELVMKENEELIRRHDELSQAAFQADEQIHLRRRLAYQKTQLTRLNDQIRDLEAAIDKQKSGVLAIQHEIRTADKESRSIARGLLPGLAVGTVTTTTGRVFNDAVIYRLEKKNIVLRTPIGQNRFPIDQLNKDNLPRLARYAFHLDELVDMSDFDTVESISAQTVVPVVTAHPSAEPVQRQSENTYDPEPASPILDTDAGQTTTTGDDEDMDVTTDDGLVPM